jgi:hypothetical protein
MMTDKQKKQLFYTAIVIAACILLLLAWKLLTALGIIGLHVSSHMYARSSTPFGFVFVLLIPMIATGVLFFGLSRIKK